jgi:hypothetical protein
MVRKPYPTDVSDAEWALVAPYLALMTEDAPQREHSLTGPRPGKALLASDSLMTRTPGWPARSCSLNVRPSLIRIPSALK